MSPLRAACFVSGGGGNLTTSLTFSEVRPDLLQVPLVVTDRPGSRAASIAIDRGLAVIAQDFTHEVGRASDCRTEDERVSYRVRARAFHDRIDEQIKRFEADEGTVDLLIFAYSRWVHGRLLQRFDGRILNQHPGDLGRLDSESRRRLTGNNPVLRALQDGDRVLRTTTFLVDEGEDTGSILCRGPEMVVPPGAPVHQAQADMLERRQKRESDRASLIVSLLLWATDRPDYAHGCIHEDGSRGLRLRSGTLLPRTGIELTSANGRVRVLEGVLDTKQSENLTSQWVAVLEVLSARDGGQRHYGQPR